MVVVVGAVVRGVVLGCVVVVPELVPPMFVVGDVFPIGGVVPGVVVGVVPLVVFGVVPVVVFGVVPVVVLGKVLVGVVVVAGVVVVGATLPGVLGGQVALLVDAPGMVVLGLVALGLVALGLDVLDIGDEVEVDDALELVTGQLAAGVVVVVLGAVL